MQGAGRAPAKRRPAFMKKRTIGLILFAALLLTAGFYPLHLLQIDAPRKERVVFIRTVEPGDRFSLMYLHSVELCRVWDYIRIDGQYRLVLDETRFGSSNTGLPSVLGAGERFTRGERTSRISGMQRTLPAVEIWVNRAYENTLEFDNEKILLPDLAGETLLRLHIRKIRLFEWASLKGGSLYHRMTRR